MKINSYKNTGKIVVVADDFTGANDTGVQFAKRQLKSMVIINNARINKSWNNCDVLVIDTESRFDSREKAYNKAYETGEILKGKIINCIYKKLDSTFRGNIGAEISGLMESLGIRHTIIAPAFPSNQRITKNGMVYINGKLLAETEISSDPRTPVNESFIPKILSMQTDKSIAVINYKDVHEGKQSLAHKLNQHISNNIEIIVIDALNNKDLDLIASVTASMKGKILFAGSPGFAEFLPEYLNPEKGDKINVVIAGSVSEVTRKQIEYANKKLTLTLVDIDAGNLLAGKQKLEKRRILEIVNESYRKGEDVIIRSAPSRTSVNNSIDYGEKTGLSRSGVSEIIALFLGKLTRDIIQEIQVNGLLLTGGDTAIKTAQALNISGTIIHDEIEPGIPYGNFIEARYSKITVVTKAGGFGSEDSIFRVLNFLTDNSAK